MSMPPEGGWPTPQLGPQPPNQPPYGPPPGYQPYPGQQPYPPQGQWQQPPLPPQKSGGATKWLLVAIAVLLVIGVTIGATLLFTRDGDGPSTPPTSDVASDIASTNDTGPVEIITEEPTCEGFNAINNALADIEQEGWGEMRRSLGPASSWSQEQREQVESVATAMQNAADQVIALARETPHRVVRELYTQFIASAQSYAGSIDNYEPSDDALASVNVGASGAITGICSSIDLGSAGRSIALTPQDVDSARIQVQDPAAATLFISAPSQACSDWMARDSRFDQEAPPGWLDRDSSVSASQWTPERKAQEAEARPFLLAYADDVALIGRNSENAVFEDFALLSAQYVRAYVAAGDSYTHADGWLIYAGFRIINLVTGACRAAS